MTSDLWWQVDYSFEEVSARQYEVAVLLVTLPLRHVSQAPPRDQKLNETAGGRRRMDPLSEALQRTLDSDGTFMCTDNTLMEAQHLLAELVKQPGKLVSVLHFLRNMASGSSITRGPVTSRIIQSSPEFRDKENATPFSFLDLPSEIRNMVYQECVVVGDVYTIHAGHTENCRSRKGFIRPQLQLFLVNKQILQDAGTIFFAENRFRFGFRQDTFMWRRPYAHWGPFDDIFASSRQPRGLLTDISQRHMKSVIVALDMRDYQKMEDDRRAKESKRIRESFAEPEPSDLHRSHVGIQPKAWTRFHGLFRCMKLDHLQISLEQCYCTRGFRYQLDEDDVLETVLHWLSAHPKKITVTDCYTVDERDRMVSWLSGLSTDVSVQGPSWDPDLEPSVRWY